jgi:hypothetical protein
MLSRGFVPPFALALSAKSGVNTKPMEPEIGQGPDGTTVLAGPKVLFRWREVLSHRRLAPSGRQAFLDMI